MYSAHCNLYIWHLTLSLYNPPCSIMVRRFDKAKPKPPNSKTSLHLRIRIETFQHSGVGYTILHHQTQQTIRMSAHASVLDKPTPEEFVWSYAFRHEVWPTQTSCTIYRGNPSKIDPKKKHIIYIYMHIYQKNGCHWIIPEWTSILRHGSQRDHCLCDHLHQLLLTLSLGWVSPVISILIEIEWNDLH